MTQRIELHAWDEQIGPDASITKVGGGKRQFPSHSKSASNIPLPLRNADFLVQMPTTGEHRGARPYVANTDLHIWRSYRAVVTTESGLLPEGKKMNEKPMTVSEMQRSVRKSLREKLRAQEARELLMLEEHQKARQAMAERHQTLAAAEESLLRTRTKKLGFEGLTRPTMRSAPPLPVIPQKEIERYARGRQQSGAASSGGRYSSLSHADNGKPFGGTPVPGEPSMERWVNKAMM